MDHGSRGLTKPARRPAAIWAAPGIVGREAELRQIDDYVDTLESGPRSMLLIGDLNHTPDSEEYRLWKAAGWIDTFAAAGKGNGFTIKADVPNRRIDYVLAAGPIAGSIAESRPLFEGAFRLDTADDDAFALSDHLPQLAVFHAR